MLKERLKNLLIDISLYYPIANRYSHNRERHRQQKEFYSKIIGADDIVFDVGANVGQRSFIFSKLARKVVAIEPQPVCLRHLRSRFRFRKNVVIEPFASGDRAGKGTLHLADANSISSMSPEFIDLVRESVFKNNRWEKKVEVEITTLDNLIAKHGVPAFIKIDVEGFEVNVLKGLSTPVKAISFEFLPMVTDEIKRCAEIIHKLSDSYVFNYSLGEELSLVLPQHVTFPEFMESAIHRISSEKNFGDIYAFLK